MRGSTKQNFWTGLKRKLGFQQPSPAAVVQAELKNDTHNVPPERTPTRRQEEQWRQWRPRADQAWTAQHARLSRLLAR
jgi:hypothetical protein